MTVEVISPVLESLIDPAAELTCLGSGFQFTEGPVWSPVDGCLYFSDIPSDTRWRWSESGGMELAMRPSFKANGLALDGEGNLLVCEHVTSAVARYRSDGTRELLAYHCGGEIPEQPERHRRSL